jgi:hypothetical protein
LLKTPERGVKQREKPQGVLSVNTCKGGVEEDFLASKREKVEVIVTKEEKA